MPMPYFLAGLAGIAGVWALVEAFVFAGEGFGRVWWWFWHIAYFWLASFPEIFLIQIALDRVQGRTISLAGSIRNFKKVNGWFLGKLIFVPSIAAGLLFLIIPGTFLVVVWQFAPFRFLDSPVSLWDSFRHSFRITRGIKFRLFLFDTHPHTSTHLQHTHT